MLAEWLAFVGVMALGQFSPGPDMLLLTRVALTEGRKAGWLVGTGIVTGLCIHAAIAIGGMAALFSRGGWIELSLRILAGSYLLWLALGLFRESFVALYGKARQDAPAAVSSRQSWYVQGLLCNVLNPKVVVFFAGVVAVFLKGDYPGWWPLLLWATIVAEGLLLWGLWVSILQARRIREAYRRWSPWLNLAFGIGLATMGVLLWF